MIRRKIFYLETIHYYIFCLFYNLFLNTLFCKGIFLLNEINYIFFNSIYFTRSTLNINKYLEEFPGLVHFIYVDRMSHRMIAPGLEFASQETLELTKKKVKKSYFIH